MHHGFKRTHDRQRICRDSRKRYRPSRGRRRARELRICSNHRRGWTGPIPRLRGHPHAHLPIFPQRLGRGSQADRMAKPVGIAIWGIHDPVPTSSCGSAHMHGSNQKWLHHSVRVLLHRPKSRTCRRMYCGHGGYGYQKRVHQDVPRQGRRLRHAVLHDPNR